jgi:hypothetical protein
VRGRLFPVGEDWYEWRQEPPLNACVLVQVATSPGGRLVLAGLRIDGAPTAELLRAVPVGRIEAAANAQLTVVEDTVVPTALQRDARYPTALSRSADQGWETVEPDMALAGPANARTSRSWTSDLLPSGSDLALAGPSVGAFDNAGAARRFTRRGTIGRDGGSGRRGRPDAFYRDVADTYLDLAQASPRPASDLAETNGVPVTTAHRWIKEARRRGFLPPGRPGKAG